MKPTGLKVRIALIVSGTMLVALLAMAALSAVVFAREVRVALESRSLAVGTSLKVQLERLLQLGLSLDDLIGFEEQCREVVQVYGGIEQALVVRPDGTILFHSQPGRKGQRLVAPALREAARSREPQVIAYRGAGGRDEYGATVPVIDIRGAHQASVVVVFPASVITGKALRVAVTTLGIGLLFLVLGATALAAVLSTHVTRPLSRLIQALQDMRRGRDLSRPVAVPAQGDMRRLAETFNGLLQDLQQTMVSKAELEEALRVLARAEDRFRRLVESSPSAIFVDCSDALVFANPTGVRLLGARGEDELRGVPFLDFVHPDSRRALREHFRSLVEGAEVFRDRDVKLLRRDGAVLQVEATGIGIDYDGTPAVQLVVHDVTERRAMQGQLVAAGRLAAVGTMARGVAHEINNPLTYVLSGLQFVAEDLRELGHHLPPDRLAELEAAIADARRGADQVRFIVSDLQAYSRDRDRLEPVQLEHALDLAASMASNHLRDRVRLLRDYGGVPPVWANEARLGQVFLNLLVNAAQAIPEGRPDQNTIRIRARAEDGWAVVEVKDSGCGIPAHIRERIFDPFFTTKAVGEGTGLGLFIADGIVKGMGGSIRFESEPGDGSTFFVTLPLASRVAARARAGETQAP